MTQDRFNEQMKRFERAASEYDVTMRRLNDQSVDEVGYLRSRYVQTQRCASGMLPLP
jgi:hypothetical protein